MTSLQLTYARESSVTGRPLQATNFVDPIPLQTNLIHGKLERSELGRPTEDDYSGGHLTRTVKFPQTGGLHIAVSEISTRSGKNFIYKLILVLGKRNQRDGHIETAYVDSASIDFPPSGEVKVIHKGHHRGLTKKTAVTDCYAWFYIPLDGAQAISNSLVEIAQTCTDQIMGHHGGKLPKENMQDHVIIYVIKCILTHLTATSSRGFVIQNSAKKEFQEDSLRLKGPGRYKELTWEGGWKDLLHPL